jgi:hypothetical protein
MKIKKLGLTVLLGVVISASVALAKDAPFPILAVRGTWEAQNDHGMQINLAVGGRVDDGQAVSVKVILKTAEGQVFAQGVAVHRLDDPQLVVVVHDAQGHALKLVMRAQGQEANNGNATGSTASKIFLTMQSLAGATGRYIFTR